RAIPAILKAMANIKNFYRKGTIENMTSFEAKAMGYGIKTGRITETQAPELAGMAQGSNLLYGIGGTALQRGWVHFMEKSGWMFEMAEQWNRRIAWRAAFDLALKHPNNKFVQASIVKFADEYQSLIQGSTGVNNLGPLTPQQAAAIVTAAHTVDQTQYVYARYARPRIGRGKIKSLIF